MRIVTMFLLQVIFLSLCLTLTTPIIDTLPFNVSADRTNMPQSGQGKPLWKDGFVYYRTILGFNSTKRNADHPYIKDVSAQEATPIEYELWFEIDYMQGHEPTPYVLNYVHDYYYVRGINVTFHADVYDETGNLTFDDPYSQLVSFDTSTDNQEFWAIEAEYNDHDFGYYSKWKWILFGATVSGQPNIAGYTWVIISPWGNDGLTGNYVFVADQTGDDWAVANLNETNGVTPQEKVEAVVLMHEMGHTIGILKVKGTGQEIYDKDLTSVMSKVNLENCNAVDEYGAPYWHYSDQYWALRNMEYYTIAAVRDVAITDVTPSSTLVTPGEIVSIDVVAANQGTEPETFNVTAYADTIEISSTNVTLDGGNSTTLTFTWDTTGVAVGNYIIRAEASVVPGETDTDDNTFVDGEVTVALPPVASFTYSPAAPLVGQTVTFNALNSYDPDGTIISYAWDFGDGTNGSGVTIDHTYTEAKAFTVTLTVTDNVGLNDNATDNVTVSPAIHDVAVFNVTPSSTSIYEGKTINIHVEVKNEGEETETFTVTAYYNLTGIGTQTVTNLAANTSIALTFTWNTTNVEPSYYTMSATAGPVPYETDLTDNFFNNGIVHVKILGDVNGDGTVNILDASLVRAAFGSSPGDFNWNPEADLNSDGIINILDALTVRSHFGETA